MNALGIGVNTDNDSLWVFSVLPSFDRDGGRVKTLNGVLESLRELERDVVVVAVGVVVASLVGVRRRRRGGIFRGKGDIEVCAVGDGVLDCSELVVFGTVQQAGAAARLDVHQRAHLNRRRIMESTMHGSLRLLVSLLTLSRPGPDRLWLSLGSEPTAA